jgi:glycogen(starch) synthase
MESTEQQPLLFEVSWETCHKIGGIYTVLRTKSPTAVEAWGDRYCLIGPYVPETASMEFEPLEPGPILGPTLAALGHEGVGIHFGRWLIAGYPRVILLECGPAFARLDHWKHILWETCGLGLPPGDAEANDAVVFAFLVARFIEELCRQTEGRRRIITHCHEWMASLALPVIRQRQLPVATVFTTHATLLGRYLCASDGDFYGRLDWLNADAEAGRLNVYHRHALERAAAHSAHAFTTVSEVTGYEAERLLHRRPDVILPNGLEVQRFAALHEFQALHAQSKERIHEFVRGHFFGSYAFDLDKTIYTFIAGRYEYRNKGMDLFIEALRRLNQTLRRDGSDVTVVAFLITPAAVRHLNLDVLKSRSMLQEMRTACNKMTAQIGERIFCTVASGRLPDTDSLMSNAEIVRLKRMIYSRRQSGLPPVVTHNMVDDGRDPILQQLRHCELFNGPEDRVKVVYHPEFIVSTNPLFGMDYEEFVRGCHLGIFPSYYEPWGYTPAECTVLGIPSVCSNLSGFGAYVQSRIPDHADRGIFVVDRRHIAPHETIDQLVNILADFCKLGRRERVNLRNRTEALSEMFDWSTLYPAYREAYDLALARTYPAG